MAVISDRTLERVLASTDATLSLLTQQLMEMKSARASARARTRKKPTKKQLAALKKGRDKLKQLRGS